MISKYFNHSLLSLLLVFFISPAFGQEKEKDTLSLSKKKNELIHIGYGTQPAWMVSSAISSVDNQSLKKSFTSDLGHSLSGNLSGLTVINEKGEPGLKTPELRLRGLNTFGPGNAPLVLVDGYEMPFSQINPQEIESVTALKDASATAIYGSKGANGVLLITTNRGFEGPLEINFNVQGGLSLPIHMPAFLNSAGYAELFNEALVNDEFDERYSTSDIEAYSNGEDPYLYPDVDWYDEVLRPSAPMMNYNLDFKGGSQTVRYYVYLGLLNEEGLYKRTADQSQFSENSNYQRFSYRTNVDLNLSNRLSAHLTLGGIAANKKNPAGNNTSDIFDLLSKIPPNSFPVLNPNGSYGGSNLFSNPYGDILEKGNYRSNNQVFQGIYKMTQQLDMITNGLSISGEIAFNVTFDDISNKTRTYARYAYSEDPSGDPIYTQIGDNTTLSPQENITGQYRNTTIRAFMDYSRSFGTNDLNGSLIFNNSSYSTGVGGLPFRDRGLFGRFTYAANKKYIGEFSFGYNASDNFPEENRWGFFPAVSAAWIVTEEDFFNVDAIDHLKIRASYGLVGNDNIGGGRYLFFEDWGGVGRYFFGVNNKAQNSYGQTSIAVEDVTWEKQNQYNIGLEANLMGNLDFTLDVFKQYRYDILTTPSDVVPYFLGWDIPLSNIGEMENLGFETKLRYNSDNSGSFNYYAQLSVWFAKNTIINNAEEIQPYEYLYRSGHSAGQPFVLEAVGLFNDQQDIDNSPVQTFAEVQPGDIKYKDQNEDGVIDNLDYYPIGKSGLPELTAGISSGFTFRNFDLDALFQAVTGRSTYLGGDYYQAFQNNGKVSEIALGRWTESNKDNATYPRLSSDNNLNNYQPSSYWQRDGSFLRLRHLELGYSFTAELLRKIGVKRARIYLNGTNLFILDKLADDEHAASRYPMVSTYSFGFNLNL